MGETVSSRVGSTSFQRLNRTSPGGVAKLHYNDAAGVEAMSGYGGSKRRVYGRQKDASGMISWSVESSGGRQFPTYRSGTRLLVEGKWGERYNIDVKNETNRRIEVVVSVDGLDVMDGRSASYSKRGYILQPHQKVLIDGFRKSHSEVAAFRFNSVANSYANRKHSDTRHVGVIGAAVFAEAWHDTVYPVSRSDAGRRVVADPFPGRFATPPEG